MPREFIIFGLQNNDYFSSGQCLAQKKLTGRMSLEKCVRLINFHKIANTCRYAEICDKLSEKQPNT